MTGQIRLVTEADAAALAAIYEPYVRETIISFELTPPTEADMRERIQKTVLSHPWLVYETGDGVVAGYAYASKHRERAAYQWSVDVSAYVHPAYHRRGIGRGLYAALFAILPLQGFVNAYAGIALPNEASVGLHRAMGFQAVGVYRHVGYKFDKWHDVSWWGLTLQTPPDAPTAPRALAEVVNSAAWVDALREGLGLIRV